MPDYGNSGWLIGHWIQKLFLPDTRHPGSKKASNGTSKQRRLMAQRSRRINRDRSQYMRARSRL